MVAIVVVALSYFSGLPWWGALIIVACSMVINSYLAEFEDRLPGGFYNPQKGNASGKDTR